MLEGTVNLRAITTSLPDLVKSLQFPFLIIRKHRIENQRIQKKKIIKKKNLLKNQFWITVMCNSDYNIEFKN
jgi:hypothetical protein